MAEAIGLNNRARRNKKTHWCAVLNLHPDFKFEHSMNVLQKEIDIMQK